MYKKIQILEEKITLFQNEIISMSDEIYKDYCWNIFIFLCFKHSYVFIIFFWLISLFQSGPNIHKLKPMPVIASPNDTA